MEDGTFISIICKDEYEADENFVALCTTLPGINIVQRLPGNELLIRVVNGYRPTYSLDRICETLVRKSRLDMFDLITDLSSGYQYRNWYYLARKKCGK